MKNEYNDPRWQKVRLRIMERDGFTCKSCGDKASTLHIHHLKYERGKKIWDANDDDLETLCDRCHNNIEHIIKYVRENSIPILKECSTTIENIVDASKDIILNDGEEISFYANHYLNLVRGSGTLWNAVRQHVN